MKRVHERTAELYNVIGIVVAGVNAVISLLHLLYEIAKDRQQKSNRPPDQG